MNTAYETWLERLEPWLSPLVILGILLTMYADYQRWLTYSEFGFLPEWWQLVLSHALLVLVIVVWFVTRRRRNRD